MIMLTKITSCENISIIRIWLRDDLSQERYKIYIIYLSSAGQYTLIICGYEIAYKGASDIWEW